MLSELEKLSQIGHVLKKYKGQICITLSLSPNQLRQLQQEVSQSREATALAQSSLKGDNCYGIQFKGIAYHFSCGE